MLTTDLTTIIMLHTITTITITINLIITMVVLVDRGNIEITIIDDKQCFHK